MARNEKKKLSFQELETHAILWATFRLEELKELSEVMNYDKSLCEDEKELAYGSLADQVYHLLAFMKPLRHDEPNLIEWAEDFVDEYYGPLEIDNN